MQIKKQLITPNLAKTYLESNLNNRRISQPVLFRYIDDMKMGRWKEDTGESIKISKDGRVLDGQHRLQAIVKSGCSIYLHVASDLDESVFDVLDTGKKRNATDCFLVAGVKQNNTIPSIITQFNLLQEGRKKGTQINMRATNAELLEQYCKDELFWQEIAKSAHAWYCSFAKILTPSFIGGFYAHFHKVNSAKAESFMNQLCNGIDIENQTISLLRNKLMQDKMSPRKMPPTLKMALIIKTWNHFIDGIEVKILKFDSVRDDFPIAKAK